MKILVTRSKLYPVPGRSTLYQWKWIYAYSIDGGASTTWGTGLAEIKSLLKRKFPGAAIVLDWDAR